MYSQMSNKMAYKTLVFTFSTDVTTAGLRSSPNTWPSHKNISRFTYLWHNQVLKSKGKSSFPAITQCRHGIKLKSNCPIRSHNFLCTRFSIRGSRAEPLWLNSWTSPSGVSKSIFSLEKRKIPTCKSITYWGKKYTCFPRTNQQNLWGTFCTAVCSLTALKNSNGIQRGQDPDPSTEQLATV